MKRTVQLRPKKSSPVKGHRSKLFLMEHGDGVTEEYLGATVMPSGLRGFLAKRFVSLMGGKERITKAQRTAIPQFVFESAPSILEPVYDPITLFEDFKKSWVTRQIYRAIRQEVLSRGWDIEAKFVVKCTKCGKEYETKVKECDYCKKLGYSLGKDYTLRDPDELQRQVAEELVKHPNPNYDFRQFLSSTIMYHLALDDIYWTVVYGYEIDSKTDERLRKPRELWVEDSRFIRPIADKHGYLGNDEYFCPLCYDSDTDQPKVRAQINDVLAGKIPQCPNCKGPMFQTTYVQALGGKIYARIAKDEIIHGSSDTASPDLFGNPRILVAIKLLRTIEAMDEYNLVMYSEGKVGSMVVFPGMEQAEVDKMLTDMNNALERKEKEELKSGKLMAKKKIRTVVLGTKLPPVRIPVMEDLEKLQSLEFYKLYVEKICALYGVTPVFVGLLESGRTGANPRMQIDVQDRTTRDMQILIEDQLTDRVFPIFGVEDWRFVFNPIEEKDELRDAQIAQTKSVTAQNWKLAGFNVTLDEEGELEVSGIQETKPEETPEETVPQVNPVPAGGKGTEAMPEESDASGALVDRSLKEKHVKKDELSKASN